MASVPMDFWSWDRPNGTNASDICLFLFQSASPVHFLTNKAFCSKSSERVTIFTVVINYIDVNTDKLQILLFKIKIF